MARRLPNRKKQKYTIIWSNKLAGHVVSREVFNRALASGWIVRTADDAAVVAHGVKAALHAGALCLEDIAKKAMIWIYTSWISIDRDSPIIQGEYFVRDIQREYGNVKSKKVEPDGTWIERCDWEVSL
jgi:hypothetical protein